MIEVEVDLSDEVIINYSIIVCKYLKHLRDSYGLEHVSSFIDTVAAMEHDAESKKELLDKHHNDMEDLK